MSRRRSAPWIYRWSRLLIGVIAIVGTVVTGYLTISHFGGQPVACPTSGCESVLSSKFAQIGSLPLSLFGTLAYASMAFFALGPLAVTGVQQKELRRKLEDWSWLLLLVGATAMVVFSGYLMWLLAFKISALCIYCLASATFTVLMLFLTLFGREWPDLGQVFFTGITVAIVAVVGTLMLYQSIVGTGVNAQNPNDPFVITSTSGPAELALADHLKSINAQMFGAFWCPHCHDQKQLFGKEAFSKIDYVECDPKGANARPDLCKAAKIEGFPTWHIKDKVLSGTQPLIELGKVSAYTGPQNFKNQVEGAVAPVSK